MSTVSQSPNANVREKKSPLIANVCSECATIQTLFKSPGWGRSTEFGTFRLNSLVMNALGCLWGCDVPGYRTICCGGVRAEQVPPDRSISGTRTDFPYAWRLSFFMFLAVAVWGSSSWGRAALADQPPESKDRYFTVQYPPSEKEGELQLGVTYTIWIPAGVKTIRGVIVHQHGCGKGACEGGATAAYDLHWQALARKFDCALLGPSYHQDDKQNCRLWCDPRNGSAATFLKSLEHFAKEAEHPELVHAPWCLWGHSGGGFWSSLMQTMYPERIVAIWLRSGTAFDRWESGEIEKPTIREAVYKIPVMCNPGAKEKGDMRFNGAYVGSREMCLAYRAKGAPIGFAPDPRTSHECGDCRYLAIPFFAACLEMRLPHVRDAEQELKDIDKSAVYLGKLEGDVIMLLKDFKIVPSESVWLPNKAVAEAWSEYVKTGAVSDKIPPPKPTAFVVNRDGQGNTTLSWSADADFESGISQFIILRDGKEFARVPEKPVGKFGRPLFQSMSYHDTPEKPLPEMKWIDPEAKPGDAHDYDVVSVNGVGLKSE